MPICHFQKVFRVFMPYIGHCTDVDYSSISHREATVIDISAVLINTCVTSYSNTNIPWIMRH